MKYRAEYTPHVLMQMHHLDSYLLRFIMSFIQNNIHDKDNPLKLAKLLNPKKQSNLHYRLGEFRILARLDKDIITILSIERSSL